MITDSLSYRDRSLRIYSGKLLMGPTGKRLFVDYLDKEPGFCGCIDFIHKVNMTSLFKVKCSIQNDFTTADTVWYPDRLEMNFENHRVSFSETKWITWDDCAVSCQQWENRTNEPFSLFLEVKSALCEELTDFNTGCCLLKSPGIHGYSIGVAVKSDTGLEKKPFIVMPGKKVKMMIVAAVGNLETETMESIIRKATDYLKKDSDHLKRHQEEYASFYEQAPAFHSSDEVLNRTWQYRWFILRHNLAQPDFGFLQGRVMYEGRSHKKTKEPFAGAGWEFSKLVNLSTPLHVTDMRWHHQHDIVYDMIRNMIHNVDENGIFCSAYVDERQHSYANYGAWAIYQFYLVDRNNEFIKEIIGKLKKYIIREIKVYSREDNLQIEVKHNRTGKEYQPSYWYFHGYPKDPKDPATYTPLKRVDRSVYHYLNVLGVAKLCEAIGDNDHTMYYEIADEIKIDIMKKMWDENTNFFYDLHYQTDEKAMVKNIVGIYPYWADITEERHLPGLEYLFDKNHFNTRCPFPSVSKECEAYRPAGSWMGNFIKGRDGCVWCGPSWPYTTGIAIDAIGIQSKMYQHRYDNQFAYFLREYALQHFRDRDIKKPYLVEHYNAETGEPLSDEADYNHSYFVNLIITHVAGLRPEMDNVEFDPIDIGLDYFILDNVNIGSDTYKVTFKRDENVNTLMDIETGYSLYKNGVKVNTKR